MGFSQLDTRNRSRRLVCASGDTRFFLTPGNKQGFITELEVDCSALSGRVGVTTIDIRDTYVPATTGTAATTTAVRKSTAVAPGDVVALSFESGPIEVIGGVDVRVNNSGPIVSLSTVFR